MKHALVAVDNEQASQRAVDWAIRRGERTPTELRVVSIEEEFWEEPPASEVVLAGVASRIAHVMPSQPESTSVLAGPIAETLIELSRQSDLLIIGSHRRHPVRAALAGSLPLRIAGRSHCTTVVVPEDWEPREGGIIVGIDDDESCTAALDFAAMEAARLSLPLEIVHAWSTWEPWAVVALVSPQDAVVEALHRDHLSAAVARAQSVAPGILIRPRLVSGTAHDALLQSTGGAELIVIGTHRHSPLVEWAVDGAALALMAATNVPIAVVPIEAPVADE